jgi:hypothetical protein
MTPSELKYNVEQAGHESHFFTIRTMKFFGDTMKNYGVRDGGTIETYSGEKYQVWELWRKKPVGHSRLKDSAYFDKQTFERRFPKR